MENQIRAPYVSSRAQKSSGSLPRNTESWKSFGNDDTKPAAIMMRSKPQSSEKCPLKSYHLHSLDRQQLDAEIPGKAHRKARSSSFHDATDEDRSWQDLTTDPTVALKLLKHQNKRQLCRFEEILRNGDSLKQPVSIHFDHESHVSQNFMGVEPRHLGCRLESLKNIISSQQFVIDSLKQSQNLDSTVLQDLLREQLFIDQELKFEKEAHGNISQNEHHTKERNTSGREDFLTKEIDALKDSLNRSHKNAEQNQAKVLLQYLEQVMKILTDLNEWLTRQEEGCSRQQPLGGDLQTLKCQRKELQIIQVDLEEKRILLEKAVETAHLAAHEESLKSLFEFGHNTPENKKLVNSIAIINDLSHALPRRWIDIRQKVVDLYIAVCSTYKSLQLLQKLLDELEKGLHQLVEKNFWLPVEKLGSDNLCSEMKRAKVYHQSISTLKFLIDDCNAVANQLQDGGLILSHKYVVRLEEYNRKWQEMNSSAEQRIKNLSDILKMKDDNIQIFLSIPIQPPWERALTPLNVPYYINHENESTQWDHPEMTNLIHDLNGLNDVRFSAYRTAMKLRMLQLRLRLSSVSLDYVVDFFKVKLCHPSDSAVSVTDVMAWLLDLFINEQNRSMPTVDLIFNWLFNVFDSGRSGYFKIISFKVSIILLCNGSLEEKFKGLFGIVADNQGYVRPSQLASLLIECLKIPLQLGEVQAFGGLNVEPSVKNCFEKVLCNQEIKCAQFLEWTKMEPQSLVWLHVFHRLVAAERSVHQARCFICKISPITGFRYHCLKCFNFDLCQNCFFSGCSARNHKLSHPMQEYFAEASSTEEMRDLKKMLKNKFRSKSYFKKHPRLGYLPVQSADEFFERSQSSSPKHFNMTPQEINDEFKQKQTRFARMSNPSIHENSDEHNLIAQYCQNLHGIDERTSDKFSQSFRKGTRINDVFEPGRVLQSEYNQIKLVRSEPSLLCRELSVDTGKEIFCEEDYLKKHKSRLEARIQFLEGQNRQLETTLDHLKNADYEADHGVRVVTYSGSPVALNEYPCLGSITMHPPPLFMSSSEKFKLL